MSHLPAQLGQPSPPSGSPNEPPTALDDLEAEGTHPPHPGHATAAIDEAAAKLGINPSTLYRKRKRYGI